MYELVFTKNQSLKGIQRRTLSELELKYEEFVSEHFTNPEPPALEPPTREEKSVEKTSPKNEKTSPKKKKVSTGEKKEKVQKKEKKVVKGKVAKN